MHEALRASLAVGGEVRSIQLEGYRVQVSIGIHPFERERPQTIVVDVELFVRSLPSAERDDIADTLDYDFLRDRIAALARSRHFNLQETLLQGIMAICLEPEEVLGATVRTAKPDVYPDCASIGYKLTRIKPGGGA